MIIACVNCNKKFNVNSELIPDEGRTIQCGSCKHIWFFNKNDQILKDFKKPAIKKDLPPSITKKEFEKTKIKNKSDNSLNIKNKDKIKNKGSEIIKYQHKTEFTFSKFISYIFVGIISLVSLIIVLDTFKSSLYVFFPNLEFLLFSLYETLKDIELFVKDLI